MTFLSLSTSWLLLLTSSTSWSFFLLLFTLPSSTAYIKLSSFSSRRLAPPRFVPPRFRCCRTRLESIVCWSGSEFISVLTRLLSFTLEFSLWESSRGLALSTLTGRRRIRSWFRSVAATEGTFSCPAEMIVEPVVKGRLAALLAGTWVFSFFNLKLCFFLNFTKWVFKYSTMRS